MRKPLRFLRQEIQELPLRHQRREFTMRRQMTKVRQFDCMAVDDSKKLLHDLMRPLQKRLQKSEFVQDFERGRMNGVAAEIAKEIAVLLKHRNWNARTRE